MSWKIEGPEGKREGVCVCVEALLSAHKYRPGLEQLEEYAILGLIDMAD